MKSLKLSPTLYRGACLLALALLAAGGCSKTERMVEATVTLPTLGGSVGGGAAPTNPLLLIRLSSHPIDPLTGAPDFTRTLSSVETLGRTFFDPVNGKGDCTTIPGTCTFNMPFPVPAGRDLRIRALLFIARTVGDRLPGPPMPPELALWTQIYAAEGDFLGASLGTSTSCPDPTQKVPTCGLSLLALPLGNVTGTASLDLPSPASDACLDLDPITTTPIPVSGPAEEALVVAYDVTTGVPLAAVDAAETTLGGLPGPGPGLDGGEFDFLSTLPAGRPVALAAIYNGSGDLSKPVSFSAVNEDLLTATGRHVGAFGFAGLSGLAGSFIQVPAPSPVPITINNCPLPGQVDVRFFEDLGNTPSPLPIGDPASPAAGTLLGAACATGALFTIMQRAQPYSVDTSGIATVIDGPAFLHTDVGHVFDSFNETGCAGGGQFLGATFHASPQTGGSQPTLTGSAVIGTPGPAPTPFGLMSLPTYVLPFLDQVIAPTSSVFVDGVPDPGDPCITIDPLFCQLNGPFSGAISGQPGLESQVCDPNSLPGCTLIPAVSVTQTLLLPDLAGTTSAALEADPTATPGGIGNDTTVPTETSLAGAVVPGVDVLLRRLGPPTACGVVDNALPISGSLVFLHPFQDPTGSLDVLFLPPGATGAEFSSCSFVTGTPLLTPPFDTNDYWQCSVFLPVLPGGTSADIYDISVKGGFSGPLNGGWASQPVSLTCVDADG